MSDTPAPVIRIVKKKQAHAAHHGGSWKVAYADFVTAMMAFFLVMWIISMDQSTRELIQNYFNDPASAANSPAGISKLAAGGKNAVANGSVGVLSGKIWGWALREAQEEKFTRVGDTIQHKIARRPELARLRKHVRVTVSQAGLTIELTEATNSLFFESGSDRLSAPARGLLTIVARELGQLANPVVIEGHTDAVPYSAAAEYTNWELSADRANTARRVMQAAGLRTGQVTEVRGYGDSKPRDDMNPKSAINRRVSILVQYDLPAAIKDGQNESKAEKGSHVPFPLRIRPNPLTDGDLTHGRN
jgi:chemotaxis protein MotB